MRLSTDTGVRPGGNVNNLEKDERLRCFKAPGVPNVKEILLRAIRERFTENITYLFDYDQNMKKTHKYCEKIESSLYFFGVATLKSAHHLGSSLRILDRTLSRLKTKENVFQKVKLF